MTLGCSRVGLGSVVGVGDGEPVVVNIAVELLGTVGLDERAWVVFKITEEGTETLILIPIDVVAGEIEMEDVLFDGGSGSVAGVAVVLVLGSVVGAVVVVPGSVPGAVV